jgi:hypothetical protein
MRTTGLLELVLNEVFVLGVAFGPFWDWRDFNSPHTIVCTKIREGPFSHDIGEVVGVADWVKWQIRLPNL